MLPIKYTPTGGRVMLALHEDRPWAVRRISDTGIGLAPEAQARIFQRFYRAPAAVSRGEEGSGLGLCIARSIVEAHGGSLQVDSAEDHGSVFTVCLPL